MTDKNKPGDAVEELLAKLVALSLWSAGASQAKIAKTVGKGNNWVNDLLKDVPKPNK